MSGGFRVSVIIPAYNAAKFLAETLDSALAQTLPAHEILVIDDGSTDDTPAIAARYAGRVTHLSKPNGGVSSARNFGIARATGNWLAFLDADDAWEPNKLERVAPVCMREPRPAVVFSDYRTFGSEDATHRPSATLAKWDSSADLLVPCISVMPSAALVPAGLPVRFPEWARNDEDAIFFNEMSELGPVRSAPDVLMRYRKHPASAQALSGNDLAGSRNLLRWAKERESAHPGTMARLFHTFAGMLIVMRWRRNWPRYWKMREFCEANWPADLPRSPVLTERVWPPVVYKLKDTLDRFRGRAGASVGH